jgi:hypothetical protein
MLGAMLRALLVLSIALAAVACGDETDPAAPRSDPSSTTGSPSAPFTTRPLLLVEVAGPDAGVDKITVSSNVPVAEGSLELGDVTLEDTNSSTTASVIDVAYEDSGFDLLFAAGTLIVGHVYDLTISAAHLTDRFGQHLPADFSKSFTVK